MTDSAPVETLTLVQLAAELGYDKELVSRLLREGKGPGIPVGQKRFIILRTWVDEWKKTIPQNWVSPPYELAVASPPANRADAV